jgi:hypothetical protein
LTHLVCVLPGSRVWTIVVPLDLLGPSFLGLKLCKKDYSPSFGLTRVAQATKELDSGASKETKIGCEKGQHNTNKEKAVTTEQESMRAQSQKIPLSLYMRCILL